MQDWQLKWNITYWQMCDCISVNYVVLLYISVIIRKYNRTLSSSSPYERLIGVLFSLAALHKCLLFIVEQNKLIFCFSCGHKSFLYFFLCRAIPNICFHVQLQQDSSVCILVRVTMVRNHVVLLDRV